MFSCFTIVGPTKKYYESLLPDFRNDELNFFSYEDDDERSTLEEYFSDEECLSPTLDDATDDPSAHNQSSIIFLFAPANGKKYLFMGDAGRAAFENIPNFLQHKIQNISWLKVPHHGSKHNMDSTMIQLMNPKTAYISSEGIGKHLNQCTVNALKKSGCDVYSTHVDHTHFLHNSINNRPGYSTAIPL